MSSRLGCRHNVGTNLTIVVLLSFGLGSAILLWTAIDRFLLHPLPVPHPESLVRAAEKHAWLIDRDNFSYSTYAAVRRMHGFEQVAAEANIDTTVTLGGAVRPIPAQMVSAGYFALLGVQAELGRTFDSADDGPHAGDVPVVLSHHFWVNREGASPGVIGSTLIVQGKPMIVSGVLPPAFFGASLDASPDLWLPLSAQPLISKKSLTDPEPDTTFSILGRLRPGVTLPAAQAEFAGIYRAILRNEKVFDPTQQGLLEPIGRGAFALHDSFARALTLLVWGWAALLAMMCANVAGLLLVRAARRERDVAIRLALGASRTHLILRALRAAAALGIAGAAGGLLVAWLGAPVLLRLLPAGHNTVSLAPQFSTVLAAVGLALLISLLFGGLPAWLSANVAPERTLHRGTATRRPGRLSRSLLILQTALTMVLLAQTGLLLRTFYVLRHTNPGFDPDHLLCFTLDPGIAGIGVPPPASLPSALLGQVRQLPGVDNASLAIAALMVRLGLKSSVALPGTKIPPQAFLNTSVEGVSSTFFDTMQMPLLAGRVFSEPQPASSDSTRPHPVPAVVNEAFARMLFPGQNPINRTFGAGATGSIATPDSVVVGVVADSKYRSLREPLLPIYYVPVRQRPDWGGQLYLYVRTRSAPAAVIDRVRGVLARLDGQLPFSTIVTVKEQISASLWQERLLAALGTIFSCISILMAAVGLYGLFALDFAQRTREFGIRSAVGAQRLDVVLLLLRDLVRLVLPGMLAGVAACFLLTRLIAFALYGVRPLDPLVIAAAGLLTALIAIAAVGFPLRRASRIDPAIVLRDE